MTDSSTFIMRLDGDGHGPRVAIKDCIAVEGLPMTAGSRALAANAQPALADAECLAGTRAADARIVGLTNMDELAGGIRGINPWFGTPVNPLDLSLIPGGSSSGSAAAVGSGEADVAFGTDSQGSIRIPAACCGVVGLRTTFGRIPLSGVRCTTASTDTVGPIGRTVADVVLGMTLLEPGFVVNAPPKIRVGRFRLSADPEIDRALDNALACAEFEVQEIALPQWDSACGATTVITALEYWEAQRDLFETSAELLGDRVRNELVNYSRISVTEYDAACAVRDEWRNELRELFRSVDVVAMPTLTGFTPSIESSDDIYAIRADRAWASAGTPALAMPIPTNKNVPASLQLIGAWNTDSMLLGIAQTIEDAIS